jgi:hypothetical protein
MTQPRILQRLIIAEALVQGIKIAAVARRLGVSRSWASREANAPETRLMLAALVERHAERMGQLLDQALTTIEAALEATKQIRFSDGQVLDVPDHRIRLEAAVIFVRLVATGVFSYGPGYERRGSLSTEIEGRTHQGQLLRKGQEQHRRPSTGRLDHKAQLDPVRFVIGIFEKLRRRLRACLKS